MRKQVAIPKQDKSLQQLMDNAIHVTNSRKSLGTVDEFSDIGGSKDTKQSKDQVQVIKLENFRKLDGKEVKQAIINYIA